MEYAFFFLFKHTAIRRQMFAAIDGSTALIYTKMPTVSDTTSCVSSMQNVHKLTTVCFLSRLRSHDDLSWSLRQNYRRHLEWGYVQFLLDTFNKVWQGKSQHNLSSSDSFTVKEGTINNCVGTRSIRQDYTKCNGISVSLIQDGDELIPSHSAEWTGRNISAEG